MRGFPAPVGSCSQPKTNKRVKRDSSTSQADSFAGANEGKMRRPASVGMTVFYFLLASREIERFVFAVFS